MDLDTVIALLPLMAFVVERAVEYLLGTLFDSVPQLTPHKWVLMYAAAGVGVIMALTLRMDMIAAAVAAVTQSPPTPTPIGIALTGALAIGGGSNIAHEIIQRIQGQ